MAVIFQWILHICILHYVWNNVIVSLFDIKPVDYNTAGCLLLLFRILFVHRIQVPYNPMTPCERACVDACVGVWKCPRHHTQSMIAILCVCLLIIPRRDAGVQSDVFFVTMLQGWVYKTQPTFEMYDDRLMRCVGFSGMLWSFVTTLCLPNEDFGRGSTFHLLFVVQKSSFGEHKLCKMITKDSSNITCDAITRLVGTPFNTARWHAL